MVSLGQCLDLLVAEAADHMVIDHTDRLHECITDRGTDKVNPPFRQIHAHPVGLFCPGRHLREGAPGVLPGGEVNIAPNESVERSVFLADLQHCPRIPDRRFNLEPVADNTGIGQQPEDVVFRIGGDFLRIEKIKCAPVMVAFPEDRTPAQSGLGTLEDELNFLTWINFLLFRNFYYASCELFP
jgi:hypothetical protein